MTAVFDVDVQGVQLDRPAVLALSDYLATSLAATGRHRVVPRAELEERLRDQKAASYRACYDESCQLEVGKEVAADHALATKVVKLGAQCVLTMKLFDLRTAATAWAATARGECGQEALLDLVDRALAGGGAAAKEPAREQAEEPAEKPASREGEPTSPGSSPEVAAPRPAACDRYAAHGLSGRADLKALPVLVAALGHLEKSYFEAGRLDGRTMLQAALSELAKCTAGLRVEGRAESTTLQMSGRSLTVPVESATSLWKLQSELRRALAWLDEGLAPAADRRALEYAALAGALSVLDQHTTFHTPRETAVIKAGMAGQFGGIGLTLRAVGGHLVVTGTVDGSPAQRAQLRAGDQLRAIDARTAEGLSMDEAVALIRGPEGSDVRVTLRRDGRDLDVTLRRERIKVPATKSRRLADGLAYLRLQQLHVSASAEVGAALASLDPLKGLILDLRGNPGGLLAQAAKIADLFLSQGLIFGTVERGGSNREERAATASDSDVTAPLVVLVDGATSSGAELLAAALEHHDRAVLVGVPTFGKGTAQVQHDLPDGATLRLTVAQYVSPGGRAFAERGFEPNVFLKDTTVGAELEGDAAIDVARKILRAAPSADKRAMLEALKRLPRDAAIDRIP